MAARNVIQLRRDLAAVDDKKAETSAKARALYATARGENRALTAAETATDDGYKALLATLEREAGLLHADLSDAEKAAALERGEPAVTKAIGAEVTEGWKKDPKRGFKSGTELLAAIYASTRTGSIDPRLRGIAATAGSDEATTQNDPYGGYLVPQGLIAPGIKAMSVETNPFEGKTTPVNMGAARILKINARVDKDHSTSVSGGLRVYRRVETQTVTTSRMKFEQVTLEKNELMGVTYAAEELLKASPEAFVSILAAGFGDEFAAVKFEEILNGDGVGRYHGIANNPALVTISKEAGQAADTIVRQNVLKMMSRCWGYGNAFWYANHGTIPVLAELTMPGNQTPMYQTLNGIATLLGRPIYFGERAAALGDLGDIICVNPSEFLEDAGAGIEQASSIHVRFLEHEQTFKFWTENAGAGWWRSALTPKRGPTMSPFVYLEAR